MKTIGIILAVSLLLAPPSKFQRWNEQGAYIAFRKAVDLHYRCVMFGMCMDAIKKEPCLRGYYEGDAEERLLEKWGLIRSKCMWCSMVYGYQDSGGAIGGTSHGYCCMEHAELDLQRMEAELEGTEPFLLPREDTEAGGSA